MTISSFWQETKIGILSFGEAANEIIPRFYSLSQSFNCGGMLEVKTSLEQSCFANKTLETGGKRIKNMKAEPIPTQFETWAKLFIIFCTEEDRAYSKGSRTSLCKHLVQKLSTQNFAKLEWVYLCRCNGCEEALERVSPGPLLKVLIGK